jgi:hypothetical protein
MVGGKTGQSAHLRSLTANFNIMKQDQDLFPHTGFPVRLEYQDGKEHKICWFQSQNHLDKHIERYKLKSKDIKIDYQDPALAKPLPVTIKPDEDDAPKKRGRKPKQQLFSSLEQFFEPNEKNVASVGTGTGRESPQKRRRGRPSSNR